MKLLTMIILLGIPVPISSATEFKSLKIDYAAKALFVERLTEVQLAKVNIEKISFSAAISQIFGGNKKKGDLPISSFVISGPPQEVDVDMLLDKPIEEEWVEPLVTYHGSNISFTTVLDSLCSQAGYVWSVADDGMERTFILIEYKVEQDRAH